MRSVYSSFFILAISHLVACSTATDFHMRDGTVHTGKVTSTSDDTVDIEKRDENVTISRNDVLEVDYPGNVHQLVGALSMIGGTAATVFGINTSKSDSFAKGVGPYFTVPGFTLLGGGLAMIVWGTLTHNLATRAYEGPSWDMMVLPTVSPDGAGAAVTFKF